MSGKDEVSAGPGPKPESTLTLERAAELLGGVKRDDYGPAAKSFESVAALWTVILGRPVAAHEVALCLAALKLWRARVSPGQWDSWVDLAGYAALGWECAVDEVALAHDYGEAHP